jgi:hypothetical protein
MVLWKWRKQATAEVHFSHHARWIGPDILIDRHFLTFTRQRVIYISPRRQTTEEIIFVKSKDSRYSRCQNALCCGMPSKIYSTEPSLCIPYCKTLPLIDADAEGTTRQMNNWDAFSTFLHVLCLVIHVHTPEYCSHRTIHHQPCRVFQACQLALEIFSNWRHYKRRKRPKNTLDDEED